MRGAAHPLVVLLEAGHDAEAGLALGTVVLGLAAQYPAVRVHGVPAEVAAEGGARSDNRTVARPCTSLKTIH